MSTDDFDDLQNRVSQTVEKDGFVSAWTTHFAEIVKAYHSSPRGASLLSDSLHAWMMKDDSLKSHLESLPGEAAQEVNRFVATGESTLKKFETNVHQDFVAGLRKLFHEKADDFSEIKESDGRPVKCLRNESFQNWGRTVQNTPALTAIPKTKIGVCNLVKWAAANNKTVRLAGYRHTWSELYSQNEAVLISLLPLDVVEDLPASEPGIDPDDQLQGIQIVGTIEEGGVTKGLCRIGSATTNEQFRLWCLSEQGGNWQWTIPLNVIMVEITWGGSNAPICHGAGLRHQTLADLVTEIEFVNAKGELQVVNDPDLLKSAAGCFGMLGVVTALTLKLDPMSYANMQPLKRHVALTIPPPNGLVVPSAIDMTGITQQQMDQAWEDFVKRCENDYYAEWFWFPFQSECWINTWMNDGDRADAKPFPTDLDIFIQEAEGYLAQLLNSTLFKVLPGEYQAKLLAAGAMRALPSDTTIVAPLIDALHFRHGIQNMRVLDMELEIPIPPRADAPEKPDWTVCQKAWWAAITNFYNRADVPMRIALEMRIMGDSNVTMAAQHGNKFGTCSIEVLTTLNVAANDWLSFMQETAGAWSSYSDPAGNRLNVRPHWAKQWQGLTFNGTSANDYLKNVAYRDRIPQFKLDLQKICAAGGYTTSDLRRMFVNPLLGDIFEQVFA